MFWFEASFKHKYDTKIAEYLVLGKQIWLCRKVSILSR